MVKILSLTATLLGAGLVSLAFLLADQSWLAGLILIIYFASTYLAARRMTWLFSPSLFLIFGFAAFGLLEGLEPIFLYSGGILSLAGWDLADFSTRIQQAEQENGRQDLQRRHLVRLGIVLAIGIGIILVSINVRLKMTFAWVSLLAIFSTLGLGRLVNYLLRRD